MFHSIEEGRAVINVDAREGAAPGFALWENDGRALRTSEWTA